MTQQKKLTDRVITHLLQTSLFETADFVKLQSDINKKFGTNISIEDLKKMANFQQLFEKIKSDYNRTNIL